MRYVTSIQIVSRSGVVGEVKKKLKKLLKISYTQDLLSAYAHTCLFTVNKVGVSISMPDGAKHCRWTTSIARLLHRKYP